MQFFSAVKIKIYETFVLNLKYVTLCFILKKLYFLQLHQKNRPKYNLITRLSMNDGLKRKAPKRPFK